MRNNEIFYFPLQGVRGPDGPLGPTGPIGPDGYPVCKIIYSYLF